MSLPKGHLEQTYLTQVRQTTVKVVGINELYTEIRAAHGSLATSLDDLLGELTLLEVHTSLVKHKADLILRAALALSIRATQVSAPAFGQSTSRAAAVNAWRGLANNTTGVVSRCAEVAALERIPHEPHANGTPPNASSSRLEAPSAEPPNIKASGIPMLSGSLDSSVGATTGCLSPSASQPETVTIAVSSRACSLKNSESSFRPVASVVNTPTTARPSTVPATANLGLQSAQISDAILSPSTALNGPVHTPRSNAPHVTQPLAVGSAIAHSAVQRTDENGHDRTRIPASQLGPATDVTAIVLPASTVSPSSVVVPTPASSSAASRTRKGASSNGSPPLTPTPGQSSVQDVVAATADLRPRTSSLSAEIKKLPKSRFGRPVPVPADYYRFDFTAE